MTRTPTKGIRAAIRRPGRPRLKRDRVLTPAERQSRYRDRIDRETIRVDRVAYDARTAAIQDLLEAIDSAARCGVPLALAAAGGLSGCTAPTAKIRALAAAIRDMKGSIRNANDIH